MHGISEISIIPIRKESSEQSEMVSQLLFGETFHIIEKTKNWSLVKTVFDNYEGWINSESISFLTPDEFEKIQNNESYITKSFIKNIISEKNNEQIKISFGSTLPNFNNDKHSFKIKENEYHLDDVEPDSNDIEEISTLFLNSPYLWGGRNPMGIDCSGFTQVIYKALGINIPRDANQQVNLGTTVNFISDTKPGDLAFFDNDEGIITHVGIVLKQNEIIHSSIKVRIDQLDQQGIYNRTLKKYTHKLRVIKRIID